MNKVILSDDEKINAVIQACISIVQNAHPEYSETETYRAAVEIFNSRYVIQSDE